ncbi:MAG: hypothetical protein V1913_04470 [Fibrobacterota bacterium]
MATSLLDISTCLTNWHKAGHGHFLIMKASGHKTISMFQKHLSFKNDDLQKLVLEGNGGAVEAKVAANALSA